jgi:hypothetical protein
MSKKNVILLIYKISNKLSKLSGVFITFSLIITSVLSAKVSAQNVRQDLSNMTGNDQSSVLLLSATPYLIVPPPNSPNLPATLVNPFDQVLPVPSNPIGYPTVYPNQYPNQYPSQYPSQDINQIYNQNQYPSLYPNQSIVQPSIRPNQNPNNNALRERALIPDPLTNTFPKLPYVVYVNGNGQFLMNILRDLEPRSVWRKYENRQVIQVGSFTNREYAIDLVSFLAVKGIQAKIQQLAIGSEFGEAIPISFTDLYPPTSANMPKTSLGFKQDDHYVIIPGEMLNLGSIREQLIVLGAPKENILMSNNLPQIVLGPFPDAISANRWQRYLQVSGLISARVYFGR